MRDSETHLGFKVFASTVYIHSHIHNLYSYPVFFWGIGLPPALSLEKRLGRTSLVHAACQLVPGFNLSPHQVCQGAKAMACGTSNSGAAVFRWPRLKSFWCFEWQVVTTPKPVSILRGFTSSLNVLDLLPSFKLLESRFSPFVWVYHRFYYGFHVFVFLNFLISIASSAIMAIIGSLAAPSLETDWGENCQPGQFGTSHDTQRGGFCLDCWDRSLRKCKNIMTSSYTILYVLSDLK